MIGSYLLGNSFNTYYQIQTANDSPLSPGRMRTQWGFYNFGRRIYSKSEYYELRRRTTPSGSFASINITSASGALVGKIRTDIQNSTMVSLEFVLDENGCADFIMKLNRLPSFPLLPFSILSVTINESEFPWYSGEISYTDDIGTQREVYEFRGFGLRNYLKGLRADTNYSAGTDIANIIRDLAQTWIEPYCPINYNSSKIPASTGVIIANDIELGKYPIDKLLTDFANMANYRWGIDGSNELYFEEITSDLVGTKFIGYALSEYKPKLNLTEVKNAIIVQRQEGRGSGGAGWVVGGIYNDDQSIKKYGKKELVYQVPGYFSDSDVDIVGNNLLEEKSEPQLSAEVNGIPIRGADSYLYRGVYRFVMPLEDYSVVANDLTDSSIFTITQNSGSDLQAEDDGDIFVYGQSAIKFSYTDGNLAEAETNIDVMGKIKKIRFYIYASKVGNFLTVGVGQTNFDENTINVPIPTSNVYFPFEWDVSSLGLMNLQKFGLRITDTNLAGTEFYINRLEVVLAGHKTDRLLLNRARYKFMPEEQAIDAEFGVLPPRMENYIASLFSISSELKYTQEVRE